MKVNSLFMYPSITKYQANFESTSSVINYDGPQRFLWSLTFMTIVLTVYLKKERKRLDLNAWWFWSSYLSGNFSLSLLNESIDIGPFRPISIQNLIWLIKNCQTWGYWGWVEYSSWDCCSCTTYLLVQIE